MAKEKEALLKVIANLNKEIAILTANLEELEGKPSARFTFNRMFQERNLLQNELTQSRRMLRNM